MGRMEPPETFEDGLIRKDILQQLQDGPSEAVKDCAESVKADNPDLTKSQAFAVCQQQENEGELSEESDDPPRENAQLPAHDYQLAQHELTADEQVRLSEEDETGARRIENVMLLAPGEWTDAASGTTIHYSAEAIQKIGENPTERITDNQVNLDHAANESVKNVGHIDTDTVHADDEGRLFGDIVLHGRTSASEDAIELMELALETQGEQGLGGVSVEIPHDGEVTEWDAAKNMERMKEFNLSGTALVMNPASEPVAFDQQFADRPVALMTPDTDQMLMHKETDSDSMDPITEVEAISELSDDATLLYEADSDKPVAAALEGETVSIDIEGADISEIRDALGKADGGGTALEGEADAAAVVDEYLANDGSPDDGVDALMQWARENTDADMDALESLAADYLTQTDAEDLSETPVSEFMAFLDEMGEDEAPDEAPEGEGESEGMNEEEQLEELREENRELREKIEAIEEQLADDGGDAEPKSLAANGGNVEDGEEEDEPEELLLGATEDGRSGYFGR